MRKIPAPINAQFNALLNKNNIPKRYQNHYLKWLRYYLDLCHKYGFSESNLQSLPKFIRKLKEKRQTDAQQKQVNEAIHIYYELIRSESRNKEREPSRYLQKPQGVNEAKNLYRHYHLHERHVQKAIKRTVNKAKIYKRASRSYFSPQFCKSFITGSQLARPLVNQYVKRSVGNSSLWLPLLPFSQHILHLIGSFLIVSPNAACLSLTHTPTSNKKSSFTLKK